MDSEIKAETDLELNKPEKIMGVNGSSGPRVKLSKAESRRRLTVMERLIISGKSNAEIEEAMEKLFGMDSEATMRLFHRTCQGIAQEGAERRPYLRDSARRRIMGYLEGAKEDREWAAIANLEKVLSAIEGTTIDPKETASPSEQRLREATIRLLNESDPKEVLAIIERERVLVFKGVDIDNDHVTKMINVTEDSECLPSPK